MNPTITIFTFLLLLSTIIISAANNVIDNGNILTSKEIELLERKIQLIFNTNNYSFYIYTEKKILFDSIEKDALIKANELVKNLEIPIACLFYLAIDERKIKIEIANGSVFEISDNLSAKILQAGIQFLKENKYFDALNLMIDKLNKEISLFDWQIYRPERLDTTLKSKIIQLTVTEIEVDMKKQELKVIYDDKIIIIKFLKYQSQMIYNYNLIRHNINWLTKKTKFRLYFRVSDIYDEYIIGDLSYLAKSE